MAYKVVPFNQSSDVAGELQRIIDAQAASGYRYVSHEYSDKLKPGDAGCFGINAKPATTVHVGFVVFQS